MRNKGREKPGKSVLGTLIIMAEEGGRDTPLRRSGSRVEMITALLTAAEGWWHLGRRDRYRAGLAGIVRLATGDEDVQVGQTTYTVTSEP